MDIIEENRISEFRDFLLYEEKSNSTVKKYIGDVTVFIRWLAGRELCKFAVLDYKEHLTCIYATASVNSAISSLNSFFAFIGRCDLKVKNLKIQRRIFLAEEKELTKAEYEKLLCAAKKKKNERLYLLMQTICSTGIRVSEVRYITVESIKNGAVEMNCKGKIRRVFLPKQLCKMLAEYTRSEKIKSGSVFITKNGKPLDRSNIWSDMKKLCEEAKVSPKKVFPHNLRHLFARTYYTLERDIVRLADILGHSSINTTRIYTAESGEIHRKQIEKLGFLRFHIQNTT